MRDSSVDLEKVRPRYVCSLLEIVHRATLRERSFIAARYAESSAHFEDTLAFLEGLGWLRSLHGRVEPANDIAGRIVSTSGLARALLLAEVLFEAAGPYQRLFAGYLAQFSHVDGELVYRPHTEVRLRDAAVRDFLMDLGAVTHRSAGDFFVLEQPFASWALWGRNVMSSSAAQLAQHAEERLAIGLNAELAVLHWEKERVGTGYVHRIRHVSQENPAACFDIQSVTVTEDTTEPRYIEVKAVAIDSFEFHWSRSEIEAAAILGPRYFLYLVPVLAPGAYDLDRMEIVPDAYEKVYKNPTSWSTAVADTICRKRGSVDP